ncbi:Thioesterase superfamily protein [Mycobacterium lentiflavum]|uniref:Thioesterase superfamily protein n=1 Tax=Mycobacterium lentiflavum TaxID=141349 RepID=A0A0E4CPL5_MYCLN|nr:PaaI family thioesterase [Mycobacterium lentiflavum]CQD18012.1 Thioesterase superfamily protein [Mycobacterium lentiflavum]
MTTLESVCEVGDRTSVEARFGLSRCRADGLGRRCDVRVGAWSLDVDGTPRPGALATALDHVLGESLALHRPQGWWTTTSELTIDFLAPFDRQSRLLATADPIRVEHRGGYAQARLIDEQGAVVAEGSTWAHHLPPRGEPALPAVRPWNEPASTVATIEDHLRYERLPSPADSVLLTLPASASWTNIFGLLHGGVWTCLSEIAAARLLSEHNPRLSTARLHVAFVRAARGDGPVTVSARARHVGSAFAVVEVLGRAADDTLCTISTVTARSRSDGAAPAAEAYERDVSRAPTKG